MWLLIYTRGGGYFHRNAIRGRAAQNGSVFDKKSLHMGPISDPQILKHWSIFRQNHNNFQKIPKHGSIFWAKSLNMGTFFTSKHGLGSGGPGGTPPSKPKSSTPPPPGFTLHIKIHILVFTGPDTSGLLHSTIMHIQHQPIGQHGKVFDNRKMKRCQQINLHWP